MQQSLQHREASERETDIASYLAFVLMVSESTLTHCDLPYVNCGLLYREYQRGVERSFPLVTVARPSFPFAPVGGV